MCSCVVQCVVPSTLLYLIPASRLMEYCGVYQLPEVHDGSVQIFRETFAECIPKQISVVHRVACHFDVAWQRLEPCPQPP